MNAFTLIELLVAMAVLTIIMVMAGSFISGVTHAIQLGDAQLDRLSQAQRSFDLVRRTLREATLHTYYDYVDVNGNYRSSSLESGSNATFVPAGYARASELRFIAGPANLLNGGSGLTSPYSGATIVTHAIFFQVPAGYTDTPSDTYLRTSLNTVGFYVEYGNRSDLVPSSVTSTTTGKRFRLMMLVEPTENLSVYTQVATSPTRTYTGQAWYTTALGTTGDVHLLAENVIAFVVRPKYYTGTATGVTTTPPISVVTIPPWTYYPYPYDSSVISTSSPYVQDPRQHQLPPVVEVTMVALDEASAIRLEQITGGNSISATGIPGLSPATLFQDPSATADPSSYSNSLTTLTDYLTTNHLSYRTFVTDVSVEGAEW